MLPLKIEYLVVIASSKVGPGQVCLIFCNSRRKYLSLNLIVFISFLEFWKDSSFRILKKNFLLSLVAYAKEL